MQKMLKTSDQFDPKRLEEDRLSIISPKKYI